jgi:1-acyl-sn-glycerol-3-phosphate acyltransferase
VTDPAAEAGAGAGAAGGEDAGGRRSIASTVDSAKPPTTGELRLYRFVRGALVGACRLWFRLSGRGLEHVPTEGAYIISPVHRSNLDFAMVLILTKRRIRYLAKDSLWKGGGFWARLFTALGGIPVARGTADREALRTCIEVIEAGEPLVIFPEGTRQHGPEVHRCFDGPAFVQSRTGVPIVPVGIGGSEAAMPKGSKVPKPRRVRVVVGAPLLPVEGDGPKARRAALRARTEELHDVIQALFDEAQAEAGTPNPPR